jgi:1-acyl-sn-glycerol-3-phosphate acyltransferase
MRAEDIALRGWLGLFGLARRYHRYEVRGLDVLTAPGAKLVVGYHGRPAAVDLCMLSALLHERLGYLPHGIIHGAFAEQRLTRWMVHGLGFVTGDGPAIAEAVRRGEHIFVQPGGTREGYRSFRRRYAVDWGDRIGYLRLALKHRLPIVPVAASGVDDVFIGLCDGYSLGKRARMPARLPLWIGVGMTGVWPLSLPFPVKIVQHIGEPLTCHLSAGVSIERGREDRQALLHLHREIAAAVQSLLDRATGTLDRQPRNGSLS